jgi:hypothetical protein
VIVWGFTVCPKKAEASVNFFIADFWERVADENLYHLGDAQSWFIGLSVASDHRNV